MTIVDRLRDMAAKDRIEGRTGDAELHEAAAERIEAEQAARELLGEIREGFFPEGDDNTPEPDGAYWLGWGLAMRIHEANAKAASLAALQDGPTP